MHFMPYKMPVQLLKTTLQGRFEVFPEKRYPSQVRIRLLLFGHIVGRLNYAESTCYDEGLRRT